jgi:hypothetical protein
MQQRTISKIVFIVGLMLGLMVAWGVGGCNPDDKNKKNGNNNNNQTIDCTGDEDEDGICDEYEGRDQGIDTDGDGTPDYLDEDSDGDGISDADERGWVGEDQPPVDTDRDGVADFRDEDSDNNGILDCDEGMEDTDNDGMKNFADLDDDGDYILDEVELGQYPSNPLDSDGDTIPDYHDEDSDADTILDGAEGDDDTDGDGTLDYLDHDADGDSISDSVEAGDDDLHTPPVDSDEDGYPDFKDSDSDNDGLADGDEDLNGNGIVDAGESDPRVADTDGDGVSDLIEVGAGTDPQDSGDNPQNNGDFVFLVPYTEDASPTDDILDFTTNLVKADLYFLMDMSGSMSDVADNIKSNMDDTIAQAINQIPDLNIGVGSFLYAQCVNYKVYDHRLDIQPDGNVAQNEFPSYDENYETGCHGGTHEPVLSALYSAATGYGTSEAANEGVLIPQGVPNEADAQHAPGACPAGHLGYPCFRPGALPIIAVVTDEALDQYVGTTEQQAIDALATISAKTIGIYGSGEAQTSMETFMTNQGSLDATGNPLVFNGDSATASAAIVEAIETLARVPMDISALAEDNDDGTDVFGQQDTVDAVEEFVAYLQATEMGQNCTPGFGTVDSDGDGNVDTFLQVAPGNPVCWKIVVRNNMTVPATEHPQLFTATIRVFGNSVTEVDSRTVFFLVPPVIEGPGVVD